MCAIFCIDWKKKKNSGCSETFFWIESPQLRKSGSSPNFFSVKDSLRNNCFPFVYFFFSSFAQFLWNDFLFIFLHCENLLTLCKLQAIKSVRSRFRSTGYTSSENAKINFSLLPFFLVFPMLFILCSQDDLMVNLYFTLAEGASMWMVDTVYATFAHIYSHKVHFRSLEFMGDANKQKTDGCAMCIHNRQCHFFLVFVLVFNGFFCFFTSFLIFWYIL